MFPVWCLPLPHHGGQAGHRETRRRITRFLGGDWESLHHEHIARCTPPPQERGSSGGGGAGEGTDGGRREAGRSGGVGGTVGEGGGGGGNLKRALLLGRSGELSRSARALVTQPLARGTEETVAQLRDLHPISPAALPDFVGDFRPPDDFILERDSFAVALRGAPSHSAAGLSGMVFEHFRDVLDPDDPASGFDLLFHVAAHVARGRIPASICHLLGASRLVALDKGGGAVRPLAVGEGFYRLISRAICLQIREALHDHFEWQYGFAFKGGCEMVIWGVRLLLESRPSWGVIQVDVKNAFNTINRQAFFEELRDSGGGVE